MNIYGVIVRDVDHDQRNVAHTGNVLIPFCHTVTDVVAAENEIRLRDLHLTDRGDRCNTALFIRSIRKLFKLKKVYKLKIRSLSLRIFFRLACCLIDHYVSVCVL